MSVSNADNLPAENPYSFIVNGSQKQRRSSLFSNQTSFRKKLLVILGGGLVLIILIVIISSLFSSKTNTQSLITIAEQQNTLITLATSAEATASQQATKNLDSNINLALTSEQLQLIQYIESAGVKITSASLKTSQAATLTAQLSAASANNFDSLYVQLTQSQLTSYIASIKQAYVSSDPTGEKVLLSNLYVSANLLLKNSNQASAEL
jgi:hypothetical protein